MHLHSGDCDSALPLVLATTVFVRHVTVLVGFEEQHLCHAFVRVDLRRQSFRYSPWTTIDVDYRVVLGLEIQSLLLVQ